MGLAQLDKNRQNWKKFQNQQQYDPLHMYKEFELGQMYLVLSTNTKVPGSFLLKQN